MAWLKERFRRRNLSPNSSRNSHSEPTISNESIHNTSSTNSSKDANLLLFPDGIKVLHHCPDAAVDICFVHGLTGDRESTWTAPGQNAPWPRGLLPSEIKSARILTFGYDAYVLQSLVASSNRLIDHATNLLTSLTTNRTKSNASSRPLIFIAHSLGGLICKVAILHSRNNAEAHLRDIFHSTIGIIFMGTPHKGSWMANWAKIPVSAISMVKSTNRSIFAALETSSQYLEAIQVGFLDMLREQREGGRSLEVTCFFEELPLRGVGQVVAKESAILPGYNSISIHANHSDMAKFCSAEENGFQLLVGELMRWQSRLEQTQSLTPNFTRNIIRCHPPNCTPVKTFVQRPALRKQIREQFTQRLDNESGSRPIIVGLSGLSGTGKSQLALSYFEHYQDCYTARFWIRAGQLTHIAKDLWNILECLSGKSPSQNEDLSAERAVQLLRKFFAGRSGTWLLVFDGADQLDNDGDANYVDIQQYIPGSVGFHILVTSRSLTARSLSTSEGIDVRELNPNEAVNVFLNCSKVTTGAFNITDVDTLVKELGYFPLAITLAGIYVSQTPRLASNLSQFLEELHEQRDRLFTRKPNKSLHGYSLNIMTAWEMSLAAAISEEPEVRRLVDLLSFLYYDDIYIQLFLPNYPQRSTFSASWSSVFKIGHIDIHTLDNCFSALEKFSLIQRHGPSSDYKMHRLVHEWGYKRLKHSSQNTQNMWLGACALVHEAILAASHDYCARSEQMRLVPHAVQCLDRLEWLYYVEENERSGLLHKLEDFGRFAAKSGRRVTGISMQKQLLSARTTISGSDHHRTLSAMMEYAVRLFTLNKFNEAESIWRELLEKQQRLVGNYHSDTLAALNGLAITIARQNSLDIASANCKMLQDKVQAKYGPRHLSSMILMWELGKMHIQNDKPDKAEPIFRQLLLYVGDDHPSTIAIKLELLKALTYQGTSEGFYELFESVMKTDARMTGNEELFSRVRSSTAHMNNPARQNQECQKFRRLQDALKTVLEEGDPFLALPTPQMAVLFHSSQIMADDRDTPAGIAHLLTKSQQHIGRFEEAEKLFCELVQRRGKMVGDDDSTTLTAKLNLASVLVRQGKLDEAEKLQRSILRGGRASSGKSVFEINVKNSLAKTIVQQGRLEEAQSLFMQVLEERKEAQGLKHVDTVLAMNNLAQVLIWTSGPFQASKVIQDMEVLLDADMENNPCGHL